MNPRNKSSDNDATAERVATSPRAQAELLLRNAILMTEMGIDMRERVAQGEKYICYLRTIACRGAKNMRTLHANSNQFLSIAHKIVSSCIANLDANSLDIQLNGEKLLSVIERELSDSLPDTEQFDQMSTAAAPLNYSDRIKYLETKQKLAESPPFIHQSCSVKSVKSDVDEKYPENWSRDSLIDLNNVVNLPPVPEDIFTCFPNANKPMRTSSLSSLKGMRKVKLFLQRAANNSDDEDSSDLDDHNDIIGDADGTDKSLINKKLCNITEETPQD